MFKNKILITLLIGILILSSCKPKAAAVNLTAALSELVGKVDIKTAASDAFKPADAKSVLEPNGQVQTGDDGRVRLDLSTGTIIRVASSSSFTLASNDETDQGLITKINLEIGKLFIILKGGSTTVETPSGVASVLGSYMQVEVDPTTGDVYVTCLEGHCTANNPAGTLDFTSGQKTTLFHKDPATGNWTVPGVEPMSPKDFQDWLDNNPEAKDLFNKAMGTATALAQPTDAPTDVATEAPTDEPTATLEATVPNNGEASTACKLINPPAGSALPFQGKVKFEWEAQPGATKYTLTFKTKSGDAIASFDTTETSIEKYIELLPAGGDYEWDVTATGESGQLCQSQTVTFTKPNSVIEMPKPPSDPTQAPAATQPPSCNPDPETCGQNCCPQPG